MKRKTTLLFLFCFPLLQAQINEMPTGGELEVAARHSVCITDEDRQQIFQEIENSRQTLIQRGILPATRLANPQVHPMFLWPLTKNPDAPYQSTWGLSNYVDHNALFPNQLQDYNCGTRTYDTAAGYNHAGIDLFTHPFPWYQMDNNQSWVVAAAPGVIVAKGNQQEDRSCNFNSNIWNAVYIEHADGSVAWYGHLKKNSLTTKVIGDSVLAGEFLGVVGSSGNSTGPHLHFEVYDVNNALVDPYVGTCNTWSSSTDTWWAAQKPYVNTKINAFLSHSAPPVFGTCPNTEVPNFKNNFNVGETVYAIVYLNDQLPSTTATIKVTRPNGSTLYNFNQSLTTSYYSSYWYWSFPANELTATGIYTMSYTYQGNTVTHQFAYGTLGVNDHSHATISFQPNPATSRIVFSENIKTLEVFNIDGKKIQVQYNALEADVSELPNGVFILRGTDENDRAFTKKLVK